MNERRKKTGILGGTFNPVHNGHLLLAEYALNELELDEVWFIPTGVSYLKAKDLLATGTDRLHMVEAAIENNSFFSVKDIEILRAGYTYTYETLEQLRTEYADREFYFITGADCLKKIDQWKNPQRIFQSCILVAATRGETKIEELEPVKQKLETAYHARIILLPFFSLSISSSEIRRRIAQGKSIRYLVPDQVLQYIEEKGLYREDNGRFEEAEKKSEKGAGQEKI